MVKKILLIILVVVVAFIIFRNIDIRNNSQQNGITTIEPISFTPSPTDFVTQQIASDSSLTWFGENKIQAKSHTGTLAFDTNTSFVGLAPKNEQGDLEVVAGQFLIDMTTMQGAEGESEMLINHLKSADFFDVDTYPTANFVITGKAENTVEGMLTIKGQTQTVSVPYTLTQDVDGRYKMEGVFQIDRTLWGVTTLSGNFFDDIGDSVVEDIIRLSFVVYTTNQN